MRMFISTKIPSVDKGTHALSTEGNPAKYSVELFQTGR